MLQIQQIRENAQKIVEKLKIKNFKNAQEAIDEVLETDKIKREWQQKTDDALAEINKISKEIGQLYQSGKKDLAEEMKTQTVAIKEKINEYAVKLEEQEKRLEELLLQIPNVPHHTVPAGFSAEDNEIVFEEGRKPDLGTNALPHWDLTAKYKLVDFELGTKITGAGFPVYQGKGARLQRALINFFLEQAIEAGYFEIQPPYVVNADSAYGTGNLPDKEGQMYHIPLDGLYLIPTAEIPVTNIYRDVILPEKDFPVKNVAYSACFRREAGSYGKDVRGLNRLHQFDKVEIVQVTHPENSYQVLEEMREHVAGLLRKLELPFRIVKLCGGDMSFTSALTYDFEVYSAAQDRWLEVSSVSNFESFQANRMKLRFKDDKGKTQLCHTLNGSALALPRILAALLENNQTEDGICLPKALHEYTKFEKITL